jgi:hypothetical protein
LKIGIFDVYQWLFDFTKARFGNSIVLQAGMPAIRQTRMSAARKMAAFAIKIRVT